MILRNLFAGALLALAPPLAFATPAHAEETGAFDKKAFEAALVKARAGDLSLDYRWLREQNLARFDYSIPRWDEQPEASAAVKDNPEKALKLANKELENNYFNAMAHAIADRALRKLDRLGEAEMHYNMVIALTESIKGGKEGSGPAQAWNVVSVDEEYATLNFHGLRPAGQSLHNEGGHVYDVMETTDYDTGEPLTLWFEIDAFYGKEFE